MRESVGTKLRVEPVKDESRLFSCHFIMSCSQTGFISAAVPSTSFCGILIPGKSTCRLTPKRKRSKYQTGMLFEPIHTLPEFLNQVVVSCGIGIMGIAGAKATEQARALIEADRKADYMDALALEMDSARRRQELSDVRGERDWNDVSVDRLSNTYVEPEVVAELGSHDELEAFDRLLLDSPAAKKTFPGAKKLELRIPESLPEPSEFEIEEEDIE